MKSDDNRSAHLHLNPVQRRWGGWTQEMAVVVGSVQRGQRVHPFLAKSYIECSRRRRSSARMGVRHGKRFFSSIFNFGWTGWTGWTGTEKSGPSCVQPPNPRLDIGAEVGRALPSAATAGLGAIVYPTSPWSAASVQGCKVARLQGCKVARFGADRVPLPACATVKPGKE
jgi:hypothetical protein